MTVDVSKLVPREGQDLLLEGIVCLSAKNYAMADQNVKFKFNGKLLKKETKNQGPTVSVKGILEAFLHCICDSCLAPVDVFVSAEADALFSSAPDDTQDNAYFFEGRHIDLTDMVNSQILLNIPITVRCSNNCKGLCFRCVCNLNETGITCACKEVC